jgi:hypothetical protein
MDYNTTRKKLVLPEYGRNVQKMVNYIKTVEDKDERTRLAHGVINIMAIMHQNSKDSTDFRRKLWDHLTIMADFELDIDAPFPPPDTFTLKQKPKRIPYNTSKIRYLHYGRVIQDMITKATEFEEGDEKKALISIIANHMKKLYLTWNREIVSDEIIFNDIYTLSEGKIQIDSSELKLADSKELMKTRRTKKPSKQTKRKK